MAGLRVQAGGGLVQQQQARVVDQRARQRQAPLHAAGQLTRLGIGLVGEGGKLQQLGHTLVHHSALQAEVAAEYAQVLGAGEVWVQCVELGDHAQLRLDGQRIAGHQQRRGARLRREVHFATVRRRQAQAHADGGGLARPVGANDPETLAGSNGEGHVVHHRGLAITFAQVQGFKKCGHGGIVCDERARGARGEIFARICRRR